MPIGFDDDEAKRNPAPGLTSRRPRGVHEGGRNIAAVPQFPPNIHLLEDQMVTLKRLGAAALLSTLIALPALAQDARRDREDRVERPAGPVDATVGAAAGIAGAAVGTAGAIATAPFRDPNAAPDSCPPGAFFTGPDGAQHPCR
jgi:hypothetical protein